MARPAMLTPSSFSTCTRLKDRGKGFADVVDASGSRSERWRAGSKLSQNRLNRSMDAAGGSMADWLVRLPVGEDPHNSIRNARADFRTRCFGLRWVASQAPGDLWGGVPCFSQAWLNCAFQSVFSTFSPPVRILMSVWRLRNFSTARPQEPTDAMASRAEKDSGDEAGVPCRTEEWADEEEIASTDVEEMTGCWDKAEIGGSSGCSLDSRL